MTPLTDACAYTGTAHCGWCGADVPFDPTAVGQLACPCGAVLIGDLEAHAAALAAAAPAVLPVTLGDLARAVERMHDQRPGCVRLDARHLTLPTVAGLKRVLEADRATVAARLLTGGDA